MASHTEADPASTIESVPTLQVDVIVQATTDARLQSLRAIDPRPTLVTSMCEYHEHRIIHPTTDRCKRKRSTTDARAQSRFRIDFYLCGLHKHML